MCEATHGMSRVRLDASTGFVSTGSVLERVEDKNHGSGRNACDIYAMEDALEKLRQRLIPQQQLCFNAGEIHVVIVGQIPTSRALTRFGTTVSFV